MAHRRGHGEQRTEDVTLWVMVRRILANWKLLLFVAVVVILGLLAEQRYGENARLVTLAIGIAGGTWLIRHLD